MLHSSNNSSLYHTPLHNSCCPWYHHKITSVTFPPHLMQTHLLLHTKPLQYGNVFVNTLVKIARFLAFGMSRESCYTPLTLTFAKRGPNNPLHESDWSPWKLPPRKMLVGHGLTHLGLDYWHIHHDLYEVFVVSAPPHFIAKKQTIHHILGEKSKLPNPQSKTSFTMSCNAIDGDNCCQPLPISLTMAPSPSDWGSLFLDIVIACWYWP